MEGQRPAPPAANANDRDDSPMVEMFTLFPHESAVVMQRGIELGIVCSCLLVMHCVYLVMQFWTSEGRADSMLRTFCMARILCAMPRPYFWVRTRRLFVQARYQPTPQMVTQRLLAIYSHPFGLERALLLFYYGWLSVVTAVVCLVRFYVESAFAQLIFKHCIYNFLSIFFHRILCVVLFYYLMHTDFKRGIPDELLEKYSKHLKFRSSEAERQLGGGEMECSICFGPYADGEEIRKLSCQHHFHQQCVDVWLLGHQNRCPLCLTIVGPQL